MRGSRWEWVVLAAVVAVLAGVSALIGDRGADKVWESRPNPSSYNPSGSGSKALFVWLQELGLRGRRWEQPLAHLPVEATVLMVLGPRLPLEEQEMKGLEAWVRGGGILVLADDAVGRRGSGDSAGGPASTFGLQLRVRGRAGTLQPAFPSPYAAGVRAIQPTGWVRFERGSSEGWAPLFGDGSGDVLVIKRLGRGRLIALADPGIFSNARLEVADHARLALNIVQTHAKGGVVLLDEFHHGHGPERGLSGYLRGTAVPWMLLQAGLTFLILLLARGTRFGAPVPSVEPARASSLEYVGALGDLYRRAGARRLAAEALAASLRRTLAAALGSRAGETAAALAARTARRFGMRAESVRAYLAPGPGAAASDEALVKYAKAVQRIEGRILRRPLHPPAGGGGQEPRAGATMGSGQ
jgi:hypothetical protein